MVEMFANGADADEIHITDTHVRVVFKKRNIDDMLASAAKFDATFPNHTITYEDEKGNEILKAPGMQQ